MYRKIAVGAVFMLAALGFMRAANFRFTGKMEAIRKSFDEQLQKAGLTRATAKGKYPTPYIGDIKSGCLVPGGTGDVTVEGNFAPGSKFVFQSDDVEVVKEALVGNQYRATLKVAPGIGPRSVSVWTMAPSTVAASSGGGAKIGGRYEWIIDSANGWRIVARSRAGNACGVDSEDAYDMEFFRKGETAVFKKLKATVGFSMYEGAYNFRMEEDLAAQAGAQDFQNLMQRMSDRNLTPAQREQIMKQLEKAQAVMAANMKAMANMEAMKQREAERQKFGCESMRLLMQGSDAAALKGELRCAPAAGQRIAVTASLKFLGR